MNSENTVEENALSLKLFVVLTRALQSIEKHVIADIKNHGLNLSEFAVLELLYNKGDQPIQKIGQKVLLASRSEEHTSELQSRGHLVCRLLLEKKKNTA